MGAKSNRTSCPVFDVLARVRPTQAERDASARKFARDKAMLKAVFNGALKGAGITLAVVLGVSLLAVLLALVTFNPVIGIVVGIFCLAREWQRERRFRTDPDGDRLRCIDYELFGDPSR